MIFIVIGCFTRFRLQVFAFSTLTLNKKKIMLNYSFSSECYKSMHILCNHWRDIKSKPDFGTFRPCTNRIKNNKPNITNYGILLEKGSSKRKEEQARIQHRSFEICEIKAIARECDINFSLLLKFIMNEWTHYFGCGQLWTPTRKRPHY